MPIDRKQFFLEPLDVDRLIDEDHRARKIWRVVEQLDLRERETITLTFATLPPRMWRPANRGCALVFRRGELVKSQPCRAGTKTTGVVRCDQPRALDLAARSGKKLEAVPESILSEVLAKLLPIIE